MKAATTAKNSRRPLSLVDSAPVKGGAKKTAPAKKVAAKKQVKAAAPKQRRITAATTDTPDALQAAEQAKGQKIFLEVEGRIPDAPAVDDPMVTAIVPNDFNLQIDHDKKFHYKKGTQEMPTSHADHWFARANGVTVYVKK